jgi:hypothetical protein
LDAETLGYDTLSAFVIEAVFVVAPTVGAVIGAMVWRLGFEKEGSAFARTVSVASAASLRSDL